MWECFLLIEVFVRRVSNMEGRPSGLHMFQVGCFRPHDLFVDAYLVRGGYGFGTLHRLAVEASQLRRGVQMIRGPLHWSHRQHVENADFSIRCPSFVYVCVSSPRRYPPNFVCSARFANGWSTRCYLVGSLDNMIGHFVGQSIQVVTLLLSWLTWSISFLPFPGIDLVWFNLVGCLYHQIVLNPPKKALCRLIRRSDFEPAWYRFVRHDRICQLRVTRGGQKWLVPVLFDSSRALQKHGCVLRVSAKFETCPTGWLFLV